MVYNKSNEETQGGQDMGKQHDRRIFAGFYKRYDGLLVYVVTVAKNANTEEPTVVFHHVNYAENTQYFTMSKQSFCEMVEIDGEYVDKFVRQTQMKITELKIEFLQNDGFEGPKRKKYTKILPDPYIVRFYRTEETYEDYAKDICDNYDSDLQKYKLCMEEKRYIGILKSDFPKLKEDLAYIGTCLKTVMKDYKEYFQERYIEHKSIRKYAADHNMNRGSVEYLQRKFITALANALRMRDESDGKCRLNLRAEDK